MRYVILFFLVSIPVTCYSQAEYIEDEFTGEKYVKSDLLRFSSEDNYTDAILTGIIKYDTLVATLMIHPTELQQINRVYFLCDGERINFPAKRKDSKTSVFTISIDEANAVFKSEKTRMRISNITFTIPDGTKKSIRDLIELYKEKIKS